MTFHPILTILPFFLTPVVAFSDAVYDLLVENANYCRVAYCSSQSTFEPVSPLSDACPLLDFCRDETDTSLEAVFDPDAVDQDQTSGFSYLTVDTVDEELHLVFRGAHTDDDYLSLVTFFQCPFVSVLKHNFRYEDFAAFENKPEQFRSAILERSGNDTVCDNCFVHCGAYLQFMKFIPQIRDRVVPYLDKGYDLIVDGFSLGGIYALLAGVEFRSQGYGPLVLTYGSLKVGNPNFNKWVDQIFENERAYSIVNGGGDLPFPSFSRVYQPGDLATYLPPSVPILLDYGHAGLQFEITKARLPHPKSVIKLGRPSSMENNDDDYSKLFYEDLSYPHLHMLIELSSNCTDLPQSTD